jgi:hypothetical protein
MPSMNPTEIDRMVLQALREIAKDGVERRVRNKPVRLAAPKNGACVYMRIALEVEKTGKISLGLLDIIAYYGELERCLRRLISRDLVFHNGGGHVSQRSFWVTME